MANWLDPDIRKHVVGDNTLSYSLFLESNIFYSEPSKKYSPYVLKDMHSRKSLLYKSIDSEKLDKHTGVLQDRSLRYTFATTSNYKVMSDSYYAVGQVYLYQIILGINKLWTMLDYKDDMLPKILIPNSDDITDLWSNLLQETNYRYMRELNDPESIQYAIERVINNIDEEFELTDIISSKLYLNKKDIDKRLRSPLIGGYMNLILSYINYGTLTFNYSLLDDIINKLFKKLKIYVSTNTTL